MNLKYLSLFLILILSFLALFFIPAISQPLSYHEFADRRAFCGVPNFFDVFSNIFFLFFGVYGLQVAWRQRQLETRWSWLCLFFGVAWVSIGSAYYHWAPDNQTLFWDRLPMTVGFMSVSVALLSEFVNLESDRLLLPAILIGVASVAYWHFTDDLRFYIWVQFAPLVMLAFLLVFFRHPYSHSYLLGVALFWYLFAKVAESLDIPVFEFLGGWVSGHTFKHLFAAVACLVLADYLKKRQPVKT